MNRDNLMRRALWVSVAYNLSGALLFAFPSSRLGQLAGLPPTVQPIYCALLALFVALFAGAYAWLALQASINRPLVAFAAIGKVGAFAVIFIFWLLGMAPSRSIPPATGDLALAGVFTWWLYGSEASAERGHLPAPRNAPGV